MMQFFSQSDCGSVRENNEDSCFAGRVGRYTVLMVADGMGGASGGEIASAAAVKTVREFIEQKIKRSSSPGQILEIMRGAVHRANLDIMTVAAGDRKLDGMGTTVDVCVIDGSTAYIAHVGDSRVYRIDKSGKAVRITRDHSLIEYMLETGVITPEEAETHPQRHVITRALGTELNVEADTYITPFEKNETLLLCSDGLTNMVSEEKIAEITASAENTEQAAKSLINAANAAGGTDNITVVLARK